MLEYSARDRDNFVEIPAGVEDHLPAGISLELLLIEIRQALKTSAFPFSIRPRHFDMPLDEALAVVHLSDQGFPDEAAWWLAREASVANCVDAVSEDSSELPDDI